MKLFIDTAKIDEIKEAFSLGIMDGITTNPSLIKKVVDSLNGESMEDYIWKILGVAKNTPVSLEIKAGTADEMYAQGKALYTRFHNDENTVVIKVPIDASIIENGHLEAIKTIKRFSDEEIPTNVTLIFTPEQALLAAKAGATYVSPFVGRLDDKIRKDNNIEFDKTDYFPSFGWNDNGHILADKGVISGVDLVSKIRAIFDRYGFSTKILAASLRNTQQVREVALAGADVATIPLNVIQQLIIHDKTKEGMSSFLNDLPKSYEDLMR